MSDFLTAEETAEIVRLLRSGLSMNKIAPMVGRSYAAVRRVRDNHDIAPLIWGRPAGSSPLLLEDPPESEGAGVGNPWIPPAGYDLYAERPSQRQWLALVAAATPGERHRLRSAMCRVLGLAPICTDRDIALALQADRRTAEELAGEYLVARGARWAA